MSECTKDEITRRQFMKQTSGAMATVAIGGAISGFSSGCTTRKHSDAKYDILIQGGQVYDGSLMPPVQTDIGIKGDKIVAVGHLPPEAGLIINAQGIVVTPGFIDIHTHCDLTFQKTGLKRFLSYVMPSWKGNHNYLYQGVTTVVTGNCGYGYTDINSWFDIVDSVNFGTNVYHLAPHGIIREELFGLKQPKELTTVQLEVMKKRVAEEMEKGAAGMSAGLAYAPGLLAETKELIELCKVVRSHEGLFTIHMRDESGKIGLKGEHAVITSIKESIEIARQTGIPVQISHLKINAPINNASPTHMLDLIAGAREEGLEVLADQYPYAAGSTQLLTLVPDEMKTSSKVKDEYRTPAGRAQIKKYIEHKFTYLSPKKILITMFMENGAYEGKYLTEIADLENMSSADMFVELVCADMPPVAVYFFQEMDIVKTLMPSPHLITASDGWTIPINMTHPHPRVYGTFPRKLKRFVLDNKIVDLTAAIHSMTGMPAEQFKMKGRGTIAVGNYADIALLNLDQVADRATYKEPHQYSEGIKYLLVNGVLSIENGKTTGNRAGRPIKKV